MSRSTRELTARMTKRLAEIRQDKLQTAHRDITEADKIINRVVSVIGEDSKERRDAAQSLRFLSSTLEKAAQAIVDAARETGEMGLFTDQQNQLTEVALGEFREADDILKKAAEIVQAAGYDVAHVETFLNAFDEYLRGDASTILRALELMEAPIIKQEAVKLSKARRLELVMALDPSVPEL